MFYMLGLKSGRKARGAYKPRLETLEGRALPTLFSVSAPPDTFADQEATAVATATDGPNEVVQAHVAGEATPAGMGTHRGAFYLGPQTDLLQIDSSPEGDQNLGDPIAVAFAYSYTATLQDLAGQPPLDPPATRRKYYINRDGPKPCGDRSTPSALCARGPILPGARQRIWREVAGGGELGFPRRQRT